MGGTSSKSPMTNGAVTGIVDENEELDDSQPSETLVRSSPESSQELLQVMTSDEENEIIFTTSRTRKRKKRSKEKTNRKLFDDSSSDYSEGNDLTSSSFSWEEDVDSGGSDSTIPVARRILKESKESIRKVVVVEQTLTTNFVRGPDEKSCLKILDGILKCLSLKDLKTCRLINKQWKLATSKWMLENDCCRVNFCWKDNCFQPRRSKTSLLDLLDDKKLIHLPCSDISFSGNGNLGYGSVNKFFQIHGVKIKTLELNRSSSSPSNKPATSKSILCNILSHQVPYMEKLSIIGYNYDKTNDDDDELQLPSLKTFAWKDAEEIAYKIVRVSPNLETVIGFNICRDLEAFVDQEKIHTVKEFLCVIGSDNRLDSLMRKFSRAGPRLENLVFDISKKISSKISKTCQKLLDESSETLQSLNVGLLCCYSDVQIPTLNKLRTLKLGENLGQPCLPKGIVLSQTFPNLQIFDCSGLSCHKFATWDSHFPPPHVERGDLPSVQMLKIGDYSDIWMRRLLTLCPNFKMLTIFSDRRLETTLVRVFRLWPHLKSLELRAKSDVICTVPSLDPVMTGLSEKTCNLLRAMRCNDAVEEMENLRVDASLCDLKDLKDLRINFAAVTDCGLLSHISGLYAFALLPNLKVTINIPQIVPKSQLISMRNRLGPFATIRQEH